MEESTTDNMVKKIIFFALLLITVNILAQETPKQQIINVDLIEIQPGVLKLARDTANQGGVFLYINPVLLQSKPKSVAEIIAYFNYLNALIEAKNEK